ncbi:Aspartate carbamoyltransferase, chloroplastic [Tetrabaena socialis]|uniref:Aspartate carbamoyltransferase, chloroplastic n=1 Tax=Tetrabaena socialis TaxID=47790 RepID=A0A2J8A0X3_9CHLO|nr:Aspartate carbamoyltransferase, chloroplastic [Tetrabaena socialis]|eukprot:PNH06181.1 Aspartate carbamoyltransferase, chloroplastic [Tetrabaena socialis]
MQALQGRSHAAREAAPRNQLAPTRLALRRAAARAAAGSATAPAPARDSAPALAKSDAAVDWHLQKLKHVVDSADFSRAAVDVVFKEAMQMEKVRPGTPEARVLDGVIMSTLFYEPSTRTRLSFESAMSRLGGCVLSTESAGEYSSAAKGETLEGEPVEGTRIQKERFNNMDDYAAARGKYIIDTDIMKALQPHAVVMHPLPRVDEVALLVSYPSTLNPHSPLLQITTDVDADPRAAYFRQARNGLYVRMALLKLCLTDGHPGLQI